MICISIGTNIKKFRKEKKLKQHELAQLLGVAPITIRQYESGKREPNLKKMFEIAEQLNVSINDLTAEDLEEDISLDDFDTLDSGIKVSKNTPPEIRNRLNNMFSDHSTTPVSTYNTTIKFDHNTPYNKAIQKLKNNEELDSEEKQALENYIQSGTLQHAFDSFGDSVKKLIEQLLQNYEELNELGKRKADEHIERAVQQVDEFVESLVKIPEYQKKED